MWVWSCLHNTWAIPTLNSAAGVSYQYLTKHSSLDWIEVYRPYPSHNAVANAQGCSRRHGCGSCLSGPIIRPSAVEGLVQEFKVSILGQHLPTTRGYS